MGSTNTKRDADRVSTAENAEDHDEIVIVHPEMGIYLGCALGLGFWSNLDAADQTMAATFENEAQAREHVASWGELNQPDDYDYVRVLVAEPGAATIDEMLQAGLGEHLGLLVEPPESPSPSL